MTQNRQFLTRLTEQFYLYVDHFQWSIMKQVHTTFRKKLLFDENVKGDMTAAQCILQNATITFLPQHYSHQAYLTQTQLLVFLSFQYVHNMTFKRNLFLQTKSKHFIDVFYLLSFQFSFRGVLFLMSMSPYTAD